MSSDVSYPLAPQGVFRTVQGEGCFLGTPTVFIRLAGCSVGCEFCDTDYSVSSRATADQIREMVARLAYGGLEWVWVTGGEPADHDLTPLIDRLHAWDTRLRVAVATSGNKTVRRGWGNSGADFISVSPHDPAKWAQRTGDQLNLVPGLNGLSLSDPSLLDALKQCERDFTWRYVTPLWDDRRDAPDPKSLKDCRTWVECRAGWRLGIQAHKVWGVQ